MVMHRSLRAGCWSFESGMQATDDNECDKKKRNENEDVCDNVEHLVVFSSLFFVSAEYVSMNDQRIRIYTIFRVVLLFCCVHRLCTIESADLVTHNAMHFFHYFTSR